MISLRLSCVQGIEHKILQQAGLCYVACSERFLLYTLLSVLGKLPIFCVVWSKVYVRCKLAGRDAMYEIFACDVQKKQFIASEVRTR
jgi:hypothetical protein